MNQSKDQKKKRKKKNNKVEKVASNDLIPTPMYVYKKL